MPAKTVIQLRKDTAANWTSVNPVLAAGEAGVETDTNKFKIGDGTSTWSQLAYFLNADDLPSPTASVSTKTTSYTLQPSDAGNIIEFTSVSPATVTVPADSSASFPVGSSIDIVNVGSSPVSLYGVSQDLPEDYGVWSTIDTGLVYAGLPINAIAHGSGLWVAGIYGTTVNARSTNGISWTSITNAGMGTNTSLSADHGNGIWVMTGAGGRITRSTNSTTWTSVTSNFGNFTDVVGVAYGNGIWIAAGQGQGLRRSTDTITWTTITTTGIAGSTFFSRIRFVNNLWVVNGFDGSTAINRVSTDSVTWTTFSTMPISYGVAYGDGKWVSAHNNHLRTSTDLVTWTTTATGQSTYYDVRHKAGEWLAIGNYAIFGSTDAISWTTSYSFPSGNSYKATLAVSDDNRWISAGYQTYSANYNKTEVDLINSKESKKTLASQYSAATIYKRAPNTWVAIGDLS